MAIVERRKEVKKRKGEGKEERRGEMKERRKRLGGEGYENFEKRRKEGRSTTGGRDVRWPATTTVIWYD